MSELVFLEPNKIDAEPFTTSKVVADNSGIKHESVVRILSKYQKDFEEFGILRFEIGEIKGRGQPERVYRLNEEQTSLLVTYLKNTPVVRTLKIELVRQFYAMRAELTRRHVERAALKPIRREMTDVIQQVDNGKWAYKKYTDLAYKTAIGKTAKAIREERGADKRDVAADYMTADEIRSVTDAQYKIAVLLDLSMDYAAVKNILNNHALMVAGHHAEPA